jgi:hypothetical protein
MTGRRVDVPAQSADRQSRRRLLAISVSGLALLGLGLAIGSRITTRTDSAPPLMVTVIEPATGGAAGSARPAPTARQALGYSRSLHGAVAAASAYISALGGPALLDTRRARRIVGSIASSAARRQLVSAYVQAAAQARARLGLDTIPAPVVIVRAASLGYRVDAFTPTEATVSIWRVGIVGSGAAVQPEQSWRTETVTLVWEKDTWKVAGLASESGPTPQPAASLASTPAELFASIPRFEEFSHVDP